jgi:aldose 1-epimerase
LPFGLGLHPFLRRTPGFRLAFSADGFLATDENAMPVRAAPMSEMPALAGEAAAAQLVGLNHGFFGWRGPAHLAWSDLGVAARLTARSSLPMLLHVYAPAHEPLICLEPVTNAPDVIHRRAFAPFADMTPLSTGEAASISLALDFSSLDPEKSA